MIRSQAKLADEARGSGGGVGSFKKSGMFDLTRLHVLGLAYYRTGQYERAVVQLEAGRNDAALPAELKLSNWLALAMARHQLGQDEEAEAALDSAKSAQFEPGQGNVMGLIQRILLREAETVFANKGRTEP